jgi:hypothetical protein
MNAVHRCKMCVVATIQSAYSVTQCHAASCGAGMDANAALAICEQTQVIVGDYSTASKTDRDMARR